MCVTELRTVAFDPEAPLGSLLIGTVLSYMSNGCPTVEAAQAEIVIIKAFHREGAVEGNFLNAVLKVSRGRAL